MRRIGALAALVLTAAIAVSRLLVAAPHALDHVYAEDGWVFLSDRVTRGAGALDTGYAGYAHLVPRVLAAASGLVPLRDYGVWCAVAAVVVVALLGAYCHDVAARLTESPWLGIAAAALLVLPAAWRTDCLANLAYLQWFLLVALAWAVVDRPTDRSTQVAGGVIGLLAAGSSPLVVLLVPTFLLTDGRRQRRGVVVGVALGLAYQAVVRLTGSMTAGGPPRRTQFKLGMVVTSLRDLGGITTTRAVLFGGLLLVAAAVVIAGGLRRPGVVGLVVGAALFGSVPTVITGTVQSRYLGAAAAMLIGAGLLAVAGRGAVVRAVAVLVPVVLSTLAFPAAAYRVSGPRWSTQVAVADQRCGAGATSTTLALSPAGTRAAVLPCP